MSYTIHATERLNGIRISVGERDSAIEFAITHVLAGSAAAAYGIAVGDTILLLNYRSFGDVVAQYAFKDPQFVISSPSSSLSILGSFVQKHIACLVQLCSMRC